MHYGKKTNHTSHSPENGKMQGLKGAEESKKNILHLSILSVFIFTELKGCEATEGFSPAKKSELEATLRTKPGSAFHLAQHHFTLTNCVPVLHSCIR